MQRELKLFVQSVLSLQPQRNDWFGTGSVSMSEPGGLTSGMDVVNNFHRDTIQYAALMKKGAAIEDIKLLADKVEADIRLLQTIGQIGDAFAQSLLKQLHNLTKT